MKSETIAPSTKKFDIKPLPGFIICKPFKEKQVGGFVIADNASARNSYAEVLAVGEPYTFYEGSEAINVVLPFKVGDVVVYKNYGKNDVQSSNTGEDLIFLTYHPEPIHTQIMAIVKHG